MSSDPLKPSVSILAKLGSISVHAEELISPDGHAFDQSAITSLLGDPEIKSWLKEMSSLALLPKKRT